MNTTADPRFAAAVHRLALEVKEDPRATRKTCPSCRATFACLPGDCWCAALHLTGPTLHLLRSKYEGCLCPACLLPFSE